MISTHFHFFLFSVSSFCFGGSIFGREIDQIVAFVLMDYVVVRGITLFDMVAIYTVGVSEKIVGAWFASRWFAVGSFMVAMKIYLFFTLEVIDAVVVVSVARFGVVTIDLFYLYKWEVVVETSVVLRVLEGLVRFGWVRFFGVSNFIVVQLQIVLMLQQ
jgi:Predicted oxidoreductases (related to aryl-alcohol dehydrogenases)